MNIIVDAMGGDNAPDAVIKGAVKAVKEIESNIILTGNEEIINKRIKEIYGKDNIKELSEKLSIKNTTEIINMEDSPTEAIRRKKDSSMVVGFEMLKNSEGDVFISAGNSGALLAGATLLVGRIKGIDRPGLAPMLPAYNSRFILMDAGANTVCKSINLLQFAKIGTIYSQTALGIEKPKVGLLNIGTEETKGTDLLKETYTLLKENANEYGINFIGNVEGRECFMGEVDVVVAEGFTGNIFLKTLEGAGKWIKASLIDSLTKNIFTKIAVVPSLPAIKNFKKMTDYKEYGGALFLGVKKPVVKAHGSSDEKLFYITIKQAEDVVKKKTVEKMIEEFEKK